MTKIFANASKETGPILATRVLGNERLNSEKTFLPHFQVRPKTALEIRKRKKRMAIAKRFALHADAKNIKVQSSFTQKSYKAFQEIGFQFHLKLPFHVTKNLPTVKSMLIKRSNSNRLMACSTLKSNLNLTFLRSLQNRSFSVIYY